MILKFSSKCNQTIETACVPLNPPIIISPDRCPAPIAPVSLLLPSQQSSLPPNMTRMSTSQLALKSLESGFCALSLIVQNLDELRSIVCLGNYALEIRVEELESIVGFNNMAIDPSPGPVHSIVLSPSSKRQEVAVIQKVPPEPSLRLYLKCTSLLTTNRLLTETPAT